MRRKVDFFEGIKRYTQSGFIDAVEIHTKDKVICLTEKSKVFFDFIEDVFKYTNVKIGTGHELKWQLENLDAIEVKSEDIESIAI